MWVVRAFAVSVAPQEIQILQNVHWWHVWKAVCMHFYDISAHVMHVIYYTSACSLFCCNQVSCHLL